MRTLLRRGPATVVAALLIAVLAACTPVAAPNGSATGTPTPAHTTSPTPSGSPSVVPEVSEPGLPAASIIIGAEATDIVDANGTVLGSLRYSTDGDEAVALATEILGPPTATEYQDRMPHFPPADGSKWGGFEIWVNRYEPYNGEPVKQPTGTELLYEPPFAVTALSSEATVGVGIAAVDGTAVGDSFASVIAGRDAGLIYADPTFAYRSVAVALPVSFPGITDAGEGLQPMAHGVIAVAQAPDGPIVSISSPTDLYSLV